MAVGAWSIIRYIAFQGEGAGRMPRGILTSIGGASVALATYIASPHIACYGFGTRLFVRMGLGVSDSLGKHRWYFRSFGRICSSRAIWVSPVAPALVQLRAPTSRQTAENAAGRRPTKVFGGMASVANPRLQSRKMLRRAFARAALTLSVRAACRGGCVGKMARRRWHTGGGEVGAASGCDNREGSSTREFPQRFLLWFVEGRGRGKNTPKINVRGGKR